MQKIKTFFVVLLLLCSFSFNSVYADVSAKVAMYEALGFETVIAVFTGDVWLITAIDEDGDRGIIQDFEE